VPRLRSETSQADLWTGTETLQNNNHTTKM
jgi:hypothetical protein